MSSQDLCETVTPEKPTQNQSCVDFGPVESGCHCDCTDWHGHPGTVQEAGAQEQHQQPFPSQGSNNINMEEVFKQYGRRTMT